MSDVSRQRSFLFALLLLVNIVILIFTLSPFDFSAADRGHFEWQTNFSDATSNILLFLPFGFLLHRLRENRPLRLFLPELAAGALLSLFIETAQLYLATRHSQYSDILCNAAGAWVGAWLAWLAKKRLNPIPDEGVGRCASKPLHGLLLMTPIPWLYGVGHGTQFEMLLAILPLTLAGSLLLGAITACLLNEESTLSPSAAALLTSAWLFVTLFYFMERQLTTFLWTSLILSILSILFSVGLEKHSSRSMRRRIRYPLAFLLLLHAVAILAFYAGADLASWHSTQGASLHLPNAHDRPMRLASMITLFLLMGYFLNPESGSSQGMPRRLATALTPALLLWLANGFFNRPLVSTAEIPLLALSLLYGGFLDQLRQSHLRKPRRHAVRLAPAKNG